MTLGVRGVSATVILGNWGRVLNPDVHIGKEFENLTTHDESIEVFFSHAWGASRMSRFMGILWYLNAPWVMMTSLIVMICICVALAFTVDGRGWYRFEATTRLTSQSAIAIGGTMLVFFLIFSLQTVITKLFLLPSRICFLDRCCISQTDAEQKLGGIREIPKILSKSRRLVVLLSDHYFERLWCCYELAVYRSSMTTDSKIVVIPLRVVTLTFVVTLFALMYSVMFASKFRTSLSDNSDRVFLIVNACFSFIWAFLAYAFSWFWSRDVRSFRQQLSQFSLANAKCTDESDRKELTVDIAKRFGDIAHFEAYVRNDLAPEITARPKIRFMIFMALPAVFSVIAYITIVTQRLGLFCMAELGETEFVRKDDLFCVLLARQQWINAFVISCELVETFCYYPVLISTVLAYREFALNLTADYQQSWHRHALDAAGVICLTGITMVEHMQFSDVVLFHSLKASILLALMGVYYVIPFFRERTSRRTSEIFPRENSGDKVIKVD